MQYEYYHLISCIVCRHSFLKKTTLGLPIGPQILKVNIRQLSIEFVISSIAVCNENEINLFKLFADGSGQMVSIGLNNTAGWKWASGAPLEPSPLVINEINHHDASATPCLSDYCGILYVSSNVAVNIFDNCCSNTHPLFACSIYI